MQESSQITELARQLGQLGEWERDMLTDYAGCVLHKPLEPHDISIV